MSAAVVVVVCVGLVALLLSGNTSGPGSEGCVVESDAFATQLLDAASTSSSSAKEFTERASLRLPDGGRGLAFAFGQERDRMTRSVALPIIADPDRLLAAGEPIRIDLELITRERGSSVFPGSARVLASTVTRDGQALEIELCVDPDAAPPGTWVGRLVTDDWRLARTSLPVEVTLKTSRADWLPWAVSVPAALVALAVQWAVVRHEAGKGAPRQARADDASTSPLPGMVVAVVVAAAIVVVIPHVQAVHEDGAWAGTLDELVDLAWGVGRSATVVYPVIAVISIVVAFGVASLRGTAGSARTTNGPVRRDADEVTAEPRRQPHERPDDAGRSVL